MLASWVSEEVKDVDLGDKRLNERMGQILDQLGSHPTASIVPPEYRVCETEQ